MTEFTYIVWCWEQFSLVCSRSMFSWEKNGFFSKPLASAPRVTLRVLEEPVINSMVPPFLSLACSVKADVSRLPVTLCCVFMLLFLTNSVMFSRILCLMQTCVWPFPMTHKHFSHNLRTWGCLALEEDAWLVCGIPVCSDLILLKSWGSLGGTACTQCTGRAPCVWALKI